MEEPYLMQVLKLEALLSIKSTSLYPLALILEMNSTLVLVNELVPRITTLLEPLAPIEPPSRGV